MLYWWLTSAGFRYHSTVGDYSQALVVSQTRLQIHHDEGPGISLDAFSSVDVLFWNERVVRRHSFLTSSILKYS